MTKANIPITTNWNSFNNFSVEQPVTNGTGFGQVGDGMSYNFGLSTQDHVNIRSFRSTEGSWTPANCAVTTGIHSFSGTKWPAMVLTLSTPSVVASVVNTNTPIDLTQLNDPNAVLTFGLSNFPTLTNIDLTNSFVDLSADNFATSCSLQWSISTTPAVAGNCLLTFPYSSLTGTDITKIVQVRFRIKVLTTCTVIITALRLLGSQWVLTNMDYDSLNGEFAQTIPTIPDPTLLTTIPNNQQLPILWRSANPTGVDDPSPIDAEMGAVICSGSQTNRDSLTIYMRGRNEAFAVQSDLQGNIQSDLQGNTPPTFGLPIPSKDAWVSFNLSWGTAPQVTIQDNSGQPGYTWTSGVTLSNNTLYYMICRLQDHVARMQIWQLDNNYNLLTLLFDTYNIPDLGLFTRAPGRIGVLASLQDGDSWVGAVHPRFLSFAEYRSAPLNSVTPVKGAQLFVNQSPDTELFQLNGVANTGWSPITSTNPAPTVALDDTRYVNTDVDQQSTIVTYNNIGTNPQGIISDNLTPINDPVSGITAFGSLHLDFSIWIPSAALIGTPITAELISSNGATFSIDLPEFLGDQWEQVSLVRPLTNALLPYPVSGLYQLAIYYSGSVPTSIWLDDVSVHEDSVWWEGRAIAEDPWSSNVALAPWTPFHETPNSFVDGIRFVDVGNTLQLRARAFRQDAAVLNSPNLIPQYAELGRLVWPENAFVSSGNPTANITYSQTGRGFTFHGTSSTSPNGVGDWQWNFGDNATGSGPTVAYHYPSWLPAGTYVVALVVTDRAGLVAQVTTTVTIV